MNRLVRKMIHFLGYSAYAAAYIGLIVLIVWFATKLDFAEKPFDSNGNPTTTVYQEYGGR